MNRVSLFLCGVALSGIALPAFAEDVPVEFAYDEGTSSGGLSLSGKALPVGTILATRFRPDHNFVLENVQVAFWGGAGKIEVHVWRDNGGSQPGTPGGLFTDDGGADRIAPHTVQTGKNGVFVDVDLSKEDVLLAATEQFWVGVRIVTAGTNVAVDKVVKDKTDINAILQTPDAPCADGCGVPGNLLIRANGHYVDPLGAFWFTEIAEQAGITAGGRMAFGDYDGDGDDDLLFGGSTLYRNDGKGHFEDVSAKSGLTGLGGSGGLWGDYDNDGHLDIFVFGGKEHLIRNQGDGTFKEVSPGMFMESADRDYPTEGAVWLDADNDGLLDIYCANYEHVYKGADGVDVLGDCDDDFLWHNNGNGTFTDIGADAGLRKSGKLCGRGPAAIDWDQDGDTDVFVNNYRLDPNLFWVNDSPLLHFTNIASKNKTIGDGHKGQSDYGHGTGAQWVDADNDGDFDLFGANLAHPRFIKFSDQSKFFRNDGAEQAWGFSELREATGIGYLETHSAPAFADFDNDGDMDLAIGAYYGDRMGQFWRNDGATGNPETWLAFSDVTYATGWASFGCASIAWADIDGDGDLDQMANNQLFRNDYSKVSGTSHHWLKVRLRGTTKVNRAAIGAWVTVATGEGQVMSRLVSGGQGLATQDALTLHFGLGAATQVQTVTVHWPGLPAEAFGPFAVDGAVEIVEGKGIVASPAAPGDADAGSTGDSKGADGVGPDSGSDVAAAAGASPASASSGCTAAPSARLPGMAWLIAGVGLALLGIRRRRPAE